MASVTKRALNLPCPFCGSVEESLTLDLRDLPTLTCGCGEEFTPQDAVAKVEASLERWKRLAAWIDNVPTGK